MLARSEVVAMATVHSVAWRWTEHVKMEVARRVDRRKERLWVDQFNNVDGSQGRQVEITRDGWSVG